MDPVSISLAAISFATAVKDLVELAQKLEHSFAKVSSNLRQAESLAIEIRQTLEQLKDFCDQHGEILSNAQDMERSLASLMEEMKSVFEKSCEIVSAPSERKLDKLKVTLGAWKNRNKIESAIRELRNRVNKCHAKFMLFAIMRIERRLVVSNKDHVQEFKAIRNEVSNIRVSDERLVAFVGTSSGTPSTLLPEINADYISDSYLRLQIRTINERMVQLSSTRSYPVEAPAPCYLRPYQPGIAIFSLPTDRIVLRQEVIAQTLTVQSLLRDDTSSLSVQKGAWTMICLSVGLSFLGMYNETALIGLWTVKLFRTLTTTDSIIYSPYLALSLHNLALFYLDVNNIEGARSVIMECLLLLKGMETSSLPRLDTMLSEGQALSTYARLYAMEGNSAKSLEFAQRAVISFEVTFSGRPVPDESWQRDTIGTFELSQVSATFPRYAIYKYLLALDRLSTSLQGAGRSSDAAQAELRASEILIYLAPLYGSGRLELRQAHTFYRLSHEQFRGFVEVDRAFSMSQRSISIFRKYFDKDRRSHGALLCDALRQNGKILGEMKRYDEALVIWKEAANLAKELVKDRLFLANLQYEISWGLHQLNRYDEAIIARTESVEVYRSVLKSISVTEAHSYYDLAVDFRLAKRYPESIRAAQMAVTQYRALTFKEPDQYTKNLAKGLNLLSISLLQAGEQEQAFNEGHEALKLYETLIRDDPGVLPEYIVSLRSNAIIAWLSDNAAKSISRCQDIIQRCHELAKRFPASIEEELLLTGMIMIHFVVLTRHNHLADATAILQKALDWYDENPANSAKSVLQHMSCLLGSWSLLLKQGDGERAWMPIQRAIDIGRPFSSNPAVASMIVRSMNYLVIFFVANGCIAKGVIAIEEAVEFAREATLENVAGLIDCLKVASLVYKYSGQAEQALGAVTEALALCSDEALAKLAKTKPYLLLCLPQSLQGLSESLAAVGKEGEALSAAQGAVDEALNLKSKYLTLPWSDIEPTYMRALLNLSIRLAANKGLLLALQIIVQCEGYYEQQAQAGDNEITDLACVLFAGGILHCAAGQHEEGIATRAKLDDLYRRMEIAFPTMARWIEIELDAQRGFSSWIALVAQLDLQCHHQDGRWKTHV